ncbi:hypothetical protein GLOTRDRAFT_21054, partial [Gloeophyllum trabeum ATCC 11539]
VVGVLVGSPKDRTAWQQVTEAASEALAVALGSYRFKASRSSHRRGDFASGNFGIAHGGGRKEPGNIRVSSLHNVEVLHALFSNPYIQYILGFTSSSLNLIAPDLYTYFFTVLSGICAQYPLLACFWAGSVFACCCFNFGPRVTAYIHTDNFNIPFGWCAITALGRFNAKRGGHLVLWDWRLVVEFPPGSTIFIPSALVRHSNIPVSGHEKRFSIVQWMPGPLCRWFDFGFR